MSFPAPTLAFAVPRTFFCLFFLSFRCFLPVLFTSTRPCCKCTRQAIIKTSGMEFNQQQICKWEINFRGLYKYNTPPPPQGRKKKKKSKHRTGNPNFSLRLRLTCQVCYIPLQWDSSRDTWWITELGSKFKGKWVSTMNLLLLKNTALDLELTFTVCFKSVLRCPSAHLIMTSPHAPVHTLTCSVGQR